MLVISFWNLYFNIQFLWQSGTTYFSSSDWSTLDFLLTGVTNVLLTRLENVRQLNIRRGKKLSFQLSQKHPFKFSEYPFKQNKNVLRNLTMLLYANFYNISLNVLRPTFFNIYNLPFLPSPNIGKIRVKVGPKTDYFSYVLSSCTNRVTVFNNFFFYWYVATQETNKTVPAIFFFPIIFWIIYL